MSRFIDHNLTVFPNRFFDNCGWLYSVAAIGWAATGDAVWAGIYVVTGAACFVLDACFTQCDPHPSRYEV